MAVVGEGLCRWGQRLRGHWESGVVTRVGVPCPWFEMGFVSVGVSSWLKGFQFVWGVWLSGEDWPQSTCA